MVIEIKYIKNKKSVDKLKELICKYLEENREDEPYAELTVNYYQDKEGNYTNKGNEYIEVRQEIYKGGECKIKIK